MKKPNDARKINFCFVNRMNNFKFTTQTLLALLIMCAKFTLHRVNGEAMAFLSEHVQKNKKNGCFLTLLDNFKQPYIHNHNSMINKFGICYQQESMFKFCKFEVHTNNEAKVHLFNLYFAS